MRKEGSTPSYVSDPLVRWFPFAVVGPLLRNPDSSDDRPPVPPFPLNWEVRDGPLVSA